MVHQILDLRCGSTRPIKRGLVRTLQSSLTTLHLPSTTSPGEAQPVLLRLIRLQLDKCREVSPSRTQSLMKLLQLPPLPDRSRSPSKCPAQFPKQTSTVWPSCTTSTAHSLT